MVRRGTVVAVTLGVVIGVLPPPAPAVSADSVGHVAVGGKGLSGLPTVMHLSKRIGLASAKPPKVVPRPKRPVEIRARRTATSYTYLMPDGSEQVRLYTGPVNYLGADRTWRPIDRRVRPGALPAKVSARLRRGNSALAPTPNSATTNAGAASTAANAGASNLTGPIETYYAPSADAVPLLTMSGTGGALGISLQGAAPVSPSTSGSVVTYSSVFPGTDVRVDQGSGFVDQAFALSAAPAPGGERWTEDLALSDGLVPVANADGSVSVLDASGIPQFFIPAPTVFDSNLDPVSGDPAYGSVTMTLTGDATVGWAIVVAVDRAWLDDPARVYPVTVDPTFIAGWTSTSIDTYVNDLDGSGNNLHQELINGVWHHLNKVGAFPAAGNNRTLMQFDLSPIAGLPVTQAQLNLYWLHTSWPNGNVTGTATAQYTVQPLADCAWSAPAANWANQPGVTTDTPLQYTAVASQFVASNITTWTQKWINGSMKNCGLRIAGVADPTNQGYNYEKFSSSDDDASGGWLRPYLQVTLAGNALNLLGDDPYSHASGGVNTASGNFTRSWTDIDPRYPGPSLKLTRTYNTLDSRTGLFGLGWSTPFDMRALSDPQGIQFILGDGRREQYWRQPDGSFKPPSGSFATVVEAVGFNTIYLQDKSQTQWFFDDTTGKPVKVLDINGHYLQFSYDTSSRLDKIQQFFLTTPGNYTAGLVLDFSYTGTSALVTGASFNAQPGWSYHYTSSKLQYACDPAHPYASGGPGCTKFVYAGSYLSAIDSANAHLPILALAYTSAATQTVSQRTDAAGNIYKYSYVPLPSQYSTACPGTVQTTVTEPNNATEVSIYRSGDGKLVCHIDEAGKITTIQYDANGFVYLVTDPLGNQRITVHDSDGNTTLTWNGVEYSFAKYDTYDRLENSCDGRCSSATTPPYTIGYHYPATPAGDTDLIWSSGPTGTSESWSYTTGAEPAALNGNLYPGPYVSGGVTDGTNKMPAGLPLAHNTGRGIVMQYAYDKYGRLVQTTDGDHLVTFSWVDSFGRPLSTRRYWSSGIGTSVSTIAYDTATGAPAIITDPVVTNPITGAAHQRQTVSTFDADGNLIRVDTNDLAPSGADATRTTYHDFDSADREYRQRDTSGTVTLWRDFDNFGRVSHVEDANQYQIQGPWNSGDTHETTTTYTNTGHVATVKLDSYTSHRIDGTALTHAVTLHSYGYDIAGRKTSDTDATQTTTSYVYDNSNRLVRTTRANGTATVVVDDRVYTNGFLTAEYGGGTLVGSTDTNPLSETDLLYDAAGRKVQTQQILNTTFGATRTEVDTLDETDNVTLAAITEDNGAGTTQVRYTHNTWTLMNRLTTTWVDGNASGTIGNAATSTSNALDARGLVTSSYDQRGATTATSYVYDNADRVTSVQSASVLVENFGGTAAAATPTTITGYNTFGEATGTRSAGTGTLVGTNAPTTTTSYDDHGRKTLISYPPYTPPGTSTPLVPTEMFSYDLNGNLSHFADRSVTTTLALAIGNHATTDYLYDDMNRSYQTTGPTVAVALPSAGTARQVTLSEYDDAGRVRAGLSASGATSSNTYDPFSGQVQTSTVNATNSSSTAPTARTITFAYDNLGRKISQTEAAGEVTQWTYDMVGDALTVTHPDQTRDQYGYWFGQVVDYKDPAARRHKTTYDTAGRILTETQTSQGGAVYNNPIIHDYSQPLHPTVTNARGYTTTYTYDEASRLIEVDQQTAIGASPHTIVVSAGYDASGDMTRMTVTNQQGTQNTKYSYNSWYLTESVTEPDTASQTNVVTTTSYNLAGQIAHVAEPAGIAIDHIYDALGRLTDENGSQSGQPMVNHTLRYDAAGRAMTFNTPTSAETISSNELGQILTANGPAGNASFSYDIDGRPVTRQDAAGTATLQWNPTATHTGRLDGIQEANSNNWRVFGYDATTGELTGVDYCTATGYSGCAAGSAAHAHRTFSYDAINGRLASDTLQNNAATVVATTAWSYDGDNNVTQKTTGGSQLAGGSVTNAYGYDGANRLTSWATNGTTTNYQYDDSSNRTQAGGTTYQYDARNRLTSSTDTATNTTTMNTYDARGAMLTSTKNGTTTTYGCDAFGRQTQAGATSYQYDGLDRIAKRNTTTFSYAGTETGPADDGTTFYSRDASGQILTTRQHGASTSLNALIDAHGDLTALFDPTGITGSRQYDPTGNILTTTGANSQAGYQGSWTDPTSNDIWMAARWYRSATATFTTEDTHSGQLNTPVSLNQYTYGDANPLLYNDPTGHDVNVILAGNAAIYKGIIDWASAVAGYTPDPDTDYVQGTLNYQSDGHEGDREKKRHTGFYAPPVRPQPHKQNTPQTTIPVFHFPGQECYALEPYHHCRLNTADLFITVTWETIPKSEKAALRQLFNNWFQCQSGLASVQRQFDSRLSALCGVADAQIESIQRRLDEIDDEEFGSMVKSVVSHVVGFVAGVGCFAVAAPETGPGALAAGAYCAAGAGALARSANAALHGNGWRATLGAIWDPKAIAVDAALGAVGGLVAGGSATETETGAATTTADDPAGATCSFDPDTQVVMADGTTKAIGRIHVGDQVQAADPTSGTHQGGRTVTAVLTHHDDDLVNVLVDGRDGKLHAIHTTDRHPFWDDTTHAWVPARELTIGHNLRNLDDHHVPVAGIIGRPGGALMDNLTVDSLHTFYVKTGDQTVLVHNTCDVGHAGDHQFPGIKAGKSQFFDGEDLGQLSDTTGRPGYLQPNGNTRYVMHGPGAVGVDATTGLPTDIYTVILAPDGSIVTMYPGTSPMG